MLQSAPIMVGVRLIISATGILFFSIICEKNNFWRIFLIQGLCTFPRATGPPTTTVSPLVESSSSWKTSRRSRTLSAMQCRATPESSASTDTQTEPGTRGKYSTQFSSTLFKVSLKSYSFFILSGNKTLEDTEYEFLSSLSGKTLTLNMQDGRVSGDTEQETR